MELMTISCVTLLRMIRIETIFLSPIWYLHIFLCVASSLRNAMVHEISIDFVLRYTYTRTTDAMDKAHRGVYILSVYSRALHINTLQLPTPSLSASHELTLSIVFKTLCMPFGFCAVVASIVRIRRRYQFNDTSIVLLHSKSCVEIHCVAMWRFHISQYQFPVGVTQLHIWQSNANRRPSKTINSIYKYLK